MRFRNRRIKLHFGKLPLWDGEGYRDPGGLFTQKISTGGGGIRHIYPVIVFRIRDIVASTRRYTLKLRSATLEIINY